MQAFYFNISFLSMGLPTICILVLNVLISVRILRTASERRALQHSKSQNTSSNPNSASISTTGSGTSLNTP